MEQKPWPAKLLLVLAAALSGLLPATAMPLPPDSIALWPGGLAPLDTPLETAERTVHRSHGERFDRAVDRISQPRMTVIRPANPNGAALLVLPGGGYRRVVIDHEGHDLAPALADSGGLTLFVLHYRLPGEGRSGDDHLLPLADAQRAMRLIRFHARQWGLDPTRLGVLGFSAGGHLAARLATGHDHPTYPAVDAADNVSARPDFQWLLYPVIDMGAHAHAGSRERLLGPAPTDEAVSQHSLQNRVRAGDPPALLVHTHQDRSVSVHNSLAYHAALMEAGVPVDLHLFDAGEHGFGIHGTQGLPVAQWPTLALSWLAHWQEKQQ